MPRQVRAVMYWGTAQGRMSKVLKTDFPRMFLFSTSASETPITTWKNTLMTVHSTVLKRV